MPCARSAEGAAGMRRPAQSSQPTLRAFVFGSGGSFLEPRLHVGNHGVGALKRTEGASGLNVGQAFGELSIDRAALLGRVILVGGRGFREDSDNAAGHPELKVLTVSVTGLPPDGRRHNEGDFSFVLHRDSHEVTTCFTV